MDGWKQKKWSDKVCNWEGIRYLKRISARYKKNGRKKKRVPAQSIFDEADRA